MSLRGFPEIFMLTILTLGDKISELVTATGIFYDLFAIQPMLHMVSFHKNAGCIELSDGINVLVLGSIQLIQRTQRPRALNVRAAVVDQLIFQSKRRSFRFGLNLFHKIFDAAVGALGKLTFKVEFKP